MMTNLAAFIFFTVTTNDWRTISTTIPAVESGTATLAVYRPAMANQVGNIRSNTVARVNWNGKTNEVVLESVVIGQVHRSIDANKIRD